MREQREIVREFIKAGVYRGAHIKRVIESFYEAKNGKSRKGVGEVDNGEETGTGLGGGETGIFWHNLSSGTFNTFCSALLSTQIRLQNPVRWSSPRERRTGMGRSRWRRRCGTGSGSHC